MSTSNFVGFGEAQRVSSRVLKPPGGGSSIVFDDEHQVKTKVRSSASPPKDVTPEPAETPKPETNGTASSPPDTPAATTTQPSIPVANGPSTNGPTTNGTATNGTATNGSASTGPDDSFPPINGTARNGTGSTGSLSQGTPSQGTPNSRSSLSTPSSASSANRLDTQNRLFGSEPATATPVRRIRDHQRSNIFSSDDNKTSFSPSNTQKPAAPATVSEGLGENKTPEQPKTQRQRIPPGGFSTQLW